MRDDVMKGKNVLITGATQGIGKATAIGLAARGAEVTIACRNQDRAAAALAEIRQRSGSQKVDLILSDLSSQKQVRDLAAEFKERHSRLDVLVNNAGVLVPSRRVASDGIEETFAVNHLASFLLTTELVGWLKKSAPARIINVSSEAHRGADMQWADLGFAHQRYRAWRAYGQSKLANILFTYELARRLAGTGVTANALHPGAIATGFGQTYGGPMRVLVRLAHPFLRSPEAGAETSLYLASAPDVEGLTGRYFSRKREIRSNTVSYDQLSQRKLWALSEEMTKSRACAA